MKTKLTKLGLDSKSAAGEVASLEIEADKLSVAGVDIVLELEKLKSKVKEQDETISLLSKEVDKLEKDLEKSSKKQPKEKEASKE